MTPETSELGGGEQVPHRQVVLTIPKRLRVYFRYDRRLLGDLAACAWRAIRFTDGGPKKTLTVVGPFVGCVRCGIFNLNRSHHP